MIKKEKKTQRKIPKEKQRSSNEGTNKILYIYIFIFKSKEKKVLERVTDKSVESLKTSSVEEKKSQKSKKTTFFHHGC